jgi:riboflavin synthase
MAETLAKTNLSGLKPGEKVNLERALRLGDRLGGHLVSGHVDGVGIITGQSKNDIAIVTEIRYPPQLGRYMVPKGSVAIDGISLTIADVSLETFSVSLIPHTRGITTLGIKKVGDKINLEVDLIAKYLEKLTAGKQEDNEGVTEGISMSMLMKQGFL